MNEGTHAVRITCCYHGSRFRSGGDAGGHVVAYPRFEISFPGSIPPGAQVIDAPARGDDPTDPVNVQSDWSNGGAGRGGDPVNLATGEHMYLPDPDISVYNPCGPAVAYRRNFIASRARNGYASPGLSPGWVDGYDVKIIPDPSDPAPWKKLRLIYPNGAEEVLQPHPGETGRSTVGP